MAELIGRMMSNPDVLTPQGVYEIFGLDIILPINSAILTPPF